MDTLRLNIAIDDQPFAAALADSPAARAFAAQLPLFLTLQDYEGTEKIAALADRLPAEPGAAHTARPGDITYYAPWGNLALFYGNGPSAPSGLVYLGRFDGDVIAALRGATRLRIEHAQ
ncbi:cyclophilin-like fold protein [Ottowia sp. SB7-C50]|uniref:cyclophilin-like fold protein n=1 Tax=Ottowia sp. SB7-C50 TaxID=3081231 RepID=UPI002954B613|nr:cyclophilin-like fold protein [Ottowia sp. SB7-C50]WOP15093.1 cyclophilin-like fold protein [Ottowia sp. SB7-C50]